VNHPVNSNQFCSSHFGKFGTEIAFCVFFNISKSLSKLLLRKLFSRSPLFLKKIPFPSFLLKGTYIATRRRGFAEVGKMPRKSKQTFKFTFSYFLFFETLIPITFK